MGYEDKLEKYGESAQKNFKVVDVIGVPHAYCIGAKHVAFASDHHNGMLNEYAIEQGEKNGIVCEACKGKLTYAEHERALVVDCFAPLKGDNDETNPELHAYLLKCKPLAEADHYVGFAFIDRTK